MIGRWTGVGCLMLITLSSCEQDGARRADQQRRDQEMLVLLHRLNAQQAAPSTAAQGQALRDVFTPMQSAVQQLAKQQELDRQRNIAFHDELRNLSRIVEGVVTSSDQQRVHDLQVRLDKLEKERKTAGHRGRQNRAMIMQSLQQAEGRLDKLLQQMQRPPKSANGAPRSRPRYKGKGKPIPAAATSRPAVPLRKEAGWFGVDWLTTEVAIPIIGSILGFLLLVVLLWPRRRRTATVHFTAHPAESNLDSDPQMRPLMDLGVGQGEANDLISAAQQATSLRCNPSMQTVRGGAEVDVGHATQMQLLDGVSDQPIELPDHDEASRVPWQPRRHQFALHQHQDVDWNEYLADLVQHEPAVLSRPVPQVVQGDSGPELHFATRPDLTATETARIEARLRQWADTAC